MTTTRRWYKFLVSFISLQIALWMGSSLLAEVLRARFQVSLAEVGPRSIMITFALIAYVTHWQWAQRTAKRSQEERSALLRWLYLYGTLAVLLFLMLTVGFGIIATFADVFTPLERPWICFIFCIEDPDMGFYFPTASSNDWVALPLLILLCLYHWRLIRRDLQVVAENRDLFAVHTLFSVGIGVVGLLLAGLGALGTLEWILAGVMGKTTTPSANNLAILIVSLPLASLLTVGLRTKREPESITNLRGILTFIFSGIGLYLFISGSATLMGWLISTIEGSDQAIAPYSRLVTGWIGRSLVGIAMWQTAWRRIQKRLLDSDPQGRWIAWRMRFSYLVVIVASWTVFIYGAQLLHRLLWRLLDPRLAIQQPIVNLWYPLTGLIVVSAVWAYHMRVMRSDDALAYAVTRSAFKSFYLNLSYTVGLFGFLIGLGGCLSVVIRAYPSMALFTAGLRNEMAGFAAMGIVGLAVWNYHSILLRSEVRLGGERTEERAIRWNQLHIISFAGLVGLLVGLAGELSLLIRILSIEPFGYGFRQELAVFTSALLVGLPAWALPWRKAQPTDEMMRSADNRDRLAISRNVYLYSCMLVSALVTLWGFVRSITEFINARQLAGDTAFLLFDLGRSIGFIFVGTGAFLYYWMVVRSDSRFA